MPQLTDPFDPKKRLNLGSQNPVYRHGDTFVKQTENPHIEEAASGFLRHLGVPHIPVTAASHRGTPYVHAPWVAGRSITETPGKDLTAIHPQHAANTLFAEWLGSISDRHGSNYKIVGGIPHSIDHGDGDRHDTFTEHSVNPGESTLMQTMRHPLLQKRGHPGFLDRPVSPDVLAAAKDPGLEAHFLHGVSHHSEGMQKEYLDRFRNRVAKVTPGMRVGDLFHAHDVLRYRGPRS